jgi:hypothetical protein
MSQERLDKLVATLASTRPVLDDVARARVAAHLEAACRTPEPTRRPMRRWRWAVGAAMAAAAAIVVGFALRRGGELHTGAPRVSPMAFAELPEGTPVSVIPGASIRGELAGASFTLYGPGWAMRRGQRIIADAEALVVDRPGGDAPMELEVRSATIHIQHATFSVDGVHVLRVTVIRGELLLQCAGANTAQTVTAGESATCSAPRTAAADHAPAGPTPGTSLPDTLPIPSTAPANTPSSSPDSTTTNASFLSLHTTTATTPPASTTTIASAPAPHPATTPAPSSLPHTSTITAPSSAPRPTTAIAIVPTSHPATATAPATAPRASTTTSPSSAQQPVAATAPSSSPSTAITNTLSPTGHVPAADVPAPSHAIVNDPIAPSDPRPALPAVPADPAARYSAAERLMATDPASARAALSALIADAPTAPEVAPALLDLARLAVAAGDDVAAHAALDRLTAHPGSASLAMPAAYLRCALERVAPALRTCFAGFRAAFPDSLRDADALARLAAATLATSDCRTALPLLAEYVRRYPNGSDAAAMRVQRAQCERSTSP